MCQYFSPVTEKRSDQQKLNFNQSISRTFELHSRW